MMQFIDSFHDSINRTDNKLAVVARHPSCSTVHCKSSPKCMRPFNSTFITHGAARHPSNMADSTESCCSISINARISFPSLDNHVRAHQLYVLRLYCMDYSVIGAGPEEPFAPSGSAFLLKRTSLITCRNHHVFLDDKHRATVGSSVVSVRSPKVVNGALRAIISTG